MNNLNNKELNALLRASFTDATPDKAEEIIAATKNKNNVPTVSVTQIDRRGRTLRAVALSAAAFVIITGLILILAAVKNNEIYATVQIESDACVEINLNRDCRPVSIGGFDNPGASLAKHIEKGASLTEAVDNTLDAMRERGSLGERGNTVLITVDAPEDAETLLNDTFEAAKESFTDERFDGAILTAVMSEDKDVQSMARRHRISAGKAEMIVELISRDRNFSADMLSRLSVNELNLLTSSRFIRYAHIGVYGVSRGCIAPDEAVRYVCAEAGVTDKDAVITLGVDNYGLVYSVTVHGSDKVYIYRLDASSGEIIAVSQGADLKTAEMADRNTPSPSKKPSDTETTATQKPQTPSEANMAETQQPYNTPTSGSPQQPMHTDAQSPTSPAYQQTSPPTQAPTTLPQTPTAPKRQKPTVKPQPATQKPTAPKPTVPKPTAAPKPTSPPQPTDAPTQPQKPDPAAFTSNNYLRYSGGIQSRTPSSSARQISLRRIINGYNIFYNNSNFPYSSVGKQGGISALVCNREQFYRLTGSTDSRYDDSYFKTHALYIHMNRDVSYHWIKSLAGAYMDGGVLYLENSESVGYYITTDADNPERIYTVAYELNKSDLKDFTNLIEYSD